MSRVIQFPHRLLLTAARKVYPWLAPATPVLGETGPAGCALFFFFPLMERGPAAVAYKCLTVVYVPAWVDVWSGLYPRETAQQPSTVDMKGPEGAVSSHGIL